jgi:hypothetical protein
MRSKQQTEKRKNKPFKDSFANEYDSLVEYDENESLATGERFNQSFFGDLNLPKSDDEEKGGHSINKYSLMMTKKGYLTYIKQIKNTLKTVLTKKQLQEIRERIEKGLKDYAHKQHKIKIEANLPRKNHVQTDSNFRGSLYRGASKNRKKWQVMKMINK